MALFESYERRIDNINAVLNANGIASIDEAKAICEEKGIDPYAIVKGIFMKKKRHILSNLFKND